MIAPATIHTSPVTVSLADLQSPTTGIPDKILLEAFGPASLGILIVSDLPPSFPTLRSRVLSKISRLAHLPARKLDDLVNARAKYLVGWSHGKESLREGVVDWLKGSYYVNTAFDENDPTVAQMRSEWKGEFEEYLAPNVWPDETGTDEGLEGFRQDVEELVNLIVDVARYVARAIDGFAEENVENWPVRTGGSGQPGLGYLEGVVSSSRTSKARLLHYFPSDATAPRTSTPDRQSDEADDSWCTTHKDHSCLTGLTSAAFFDESEANIELDSATTTSTSFSKYQELDKSPSPTAGLYILDRTSQIHKVSIPRDCLAFQTGEALERVTKGKLKAVPHFVRGVDNINDQGIQNRLIARNTLAVFTQPNLFEIVDLDRRLNFGEYAREIVEKNTTTTTTTNTTTNTNTNTNT